MFALWVAMNQFIPRVVSIIFCLAGVLGFWGFGVLVLYFAADTEFEFVHSNRFCIRHKLLKILLRYIFFMHIHYFVSPQVKFILFRFIYCLCYLHTLLWFVYFGNRAKHYAPVYTLFCLHSIQNSTDIT